MYYVCILVNIYIYVSTEKCPVIWPPGKVNIVMFYLQSVFVLEQVGWTQRRVFGSQGWLKLMARWHTTEILTNWYPKWWGFKMYLRLPNMDILGNVRFQGGYLFQSSYDMFLLGIMKGATKYIPSTKVSMSYYSNWESRNYPAFLLLGFRKAPYLVGKYMKIPRSPNIDKVDSVL